MRFPCTAVRLLIRWNNILLGLAWIAMGAGAAPANSRILGNSPNDRIRHANLVIATGRYAEGLDEWLAVWSSTRLKGPKVDKTHLDVLEILGGFGDVYPPPHVAFEKFLKEEVNPLNDCNAHFRIGKLYVSMGHYPEALAEFVWCWDQAPPDDAYAMSLRRGQVVQCIADLGREYPPAVEVLQKRQENPRFATNRAETERDREALERALKSVERAAK